MFEKSQAAPSSEHIIAIPIFAKLLSRVVVRPECIAQIAVEPLLRFRLVTRREVAAFGCGRWRVSRTRISLFHAPTGCRGPRRSEKRNDVGDQA